MTNIESETLQQSFETPAQKKVRCREALVENERTKLKNQYDDQEQANILDMLKTEFNDLYQAWGLVEIPKSIALFKSQVDLQSTAVNNEFKNAAASVRTELHKENERVQKFLDRRDVNGILEYLKGRISKIREDAAKTQQRISDFEANASEVCSEPILEADREILLEILRVAHERVNRAIEILGTQSSNYYNSDNREETEKRLGQLYELIRVDGQCSQLLQQANTMALEAIISKEEKALRFSQIGQAQQEIFEKALANWTDYFKIRSDKKSYSTRDIANELGRSSTDIIDYHLDSMADQGLIPHRKEVKKRWRPKKNNGEPKPDTPPKTTEKWKLCRLDFEIAVAYIRHHGHDA